MTNPLFDQTTDATEQGLIEDLLEEAIGIHGVSMTYLPRKFYSIDPVLSEDAQSYFDDAVDFDAYVESFDSFAGQGDFLNQFGIQLRDRIELTVGSRHWAEVVGSALGLSRPREGDLVWFATNGRLFEVREVKRYAKFYPLGSLPVWSLTCELIEASSQRFDTGIPELDSIEQETTMDVLRFALVTAEGYPLRTVAGDYLVSDARDETATDPLDETAAVHSAAESVIDDSEADIFSGGEWSAP